MLAGLKIVVKVVALSTLAGAVVGVMVGALVEDFLLWTALMAGVGAATGLAFAYGFLPEQ